MNLIDVKSIVANIMFADSMRSNRLAQQKSTQDAQITAYQALNTSLLQVGDSASNVAALTASDATSVVKSAVSSLVDALNSSLALITNQISANGALNTDFSPREISQRLLNTTWDTDNTTSLSNAGIELTKFGTFTFNEAKLTSALAGASAGAILAEVTAFGERVQEVTDSATTVTGSIAREINTRQSRISELSTAITDLAASLARREESLTIYYSEINARIQALQNQQNYLKTQLNVFTEALNKK
jgi:flagellar hook-associated protein 2